MTTLILGIESSCDETAAAVVADGRHVLANVVATQLDLHAQYGGVFPELAARAHIAQIYPVIQTALQQAQVTWTDLTAIAVTQGPGLAGSLLVGVQAAKGIAVASELPLLGIHHLEGHIYALWLTEYANQIEFPLLVLLVSGGHTDLFLMSGHLQYQRLGGTRDDAAGEAYDKVGRMLGLPFPGGPHLEKVARSGDPHAFAFPASPQSGWDFSFSGLKTAVLRQLQQLAPGVAIGRVPPPAGLPIADIAASFQHAAITLLVQKTIAAADHFNARAILVAGGVSANRALQAALQAQAGAYPVFVPPLALCTDNAAMIAAAGFYRWQAGMRGNLDFDIRPTWALS